VKISLLSNNNFWEYRGGKLNLGGMGITGMPLTLLATIGWVWDS